MCHGEDDDDDDDDDDDEEKMKCDDDMMMMMMMMMEKMRIKYVLKNLHILYVESSCLLQSLLSTVQ